MKSIQYILLLLININSFAQSNDKTVVHGFVTSESIHFQPFSYSGIMYKQHDTDSTWIMSNISVDSTGYFEKIFPKNIRIELHTYYDNFYHSDTTVYTFKMDSLLLRFDAKPKIFAYTEDRAKKDLSAGLIKLIISDSIIYDWNEKIYFSDKFGFKYEYWPEYEDYEFRKNLDAYNLTVEDHLNSLNRIGWYNELNIIIDSLTHLEADQYGKVHDIDLDKLSIANLDKLPQFMDETIADKKSEFQRLFGRGKIKPTDYSKDFMLNKIDNDQNYKYIFLCEYWLAYYYVDMIPELVKRLNNNKEVGLTNTADLIIAERIESGDLKYYGHGGVALDDLFKISGRVNHLLRRITRVDFGNVSMYSTEKELKKLQNRWAYWLLKLNSE